jgi:hypothetical protein
MEFNGARHADSYPNFSLPPPRQGSRNLPVPMVPILILGIVRSDVPHLQVRVWRPAVNRLLGSMNSGSATSSGHQRLLHERPDTRNFLLSA